MSRRKTASEVAADAAELAGEAAKAAADAARNEEDDGEGREAKAAEDLNLGPLFSLKGEKAKHHARTRVYREEPIDEGHVGDVGPDATEVDIRRRWGGGVFRLQAVDENGGFLKQISNVKISGEPVFDNDLSARKYQKWLSQNFGEDAAPPSEMMAPSPMMGDMMATEDARHNREMARIRAETEAAVAKARAEAEATVAKAKAEATEREEAEERRRRREREERRQEREEAEQREDARRAREREERRAEREEAWAREDAKHRAEMELRREELQHRGDPITQFATFAKVVADLRGGDAGPEDPVTAMVARLPEILQEVRATGVAMSAVSGGGKKATGTSGFDPNRGDVALTGEIAHKASRAITALQRSGVDPEAALSRAFDALATARPGPKPAPQIQKPPQQARPANGFPPQKLPAPVKPEAEAAPEPAKA